MGSFATDFSFNTVLSKLIYAVSRISISIYDWKYVTFCLFAYYFMDICVTSTVLTVMDSAAMSICGHIFEVFISLAYIPRSGIARAYVTSISDPLRDCQTVFQSGCNMLCSRQLQERIQFPLFANTCYCPFHSDHFVWCRLAEDAEQLGNIPPIICLLFLGFPREIPNLFRLEEVPWLPPCHPLCCSGAPVCIHSLFTQAHWSSLG